MSQDNTTHTYQMAVLVSFCCAFETAKRELDKLNADILSEDAIDNLKDIFKLAESHVEVLERSTYKLLD